MNQNVFNIPSSKDSKLQEVTSSSNGTGTKKNFFDDAFNDKLQSDFDNEDSITLENMLIVLKHIPNLTTTKYGISSPVEDEAGY